MRTTIALEAPVRDRLLDLKRLWGLPSLEAVLVRLLDGEPRGARALYLANKAKVDAVIRRRRLRRLAAFGSRARGDARPDSDLDLVADLPADADLFDAVHIQDELAQAFGTPVHLTPRQGLAPALRRRIEGEQVALAG